DRLKTNQGTIINVSSGLAFVPLQASPIYCATKAGLHSYTITLRQQLAGKVEVIELMPPAVKTALTEDFEGNDDFKLITTAQLIDATIPQLRSGAAEIRPGQSNQLHWMSRIAPGFIQGQLAKGSEGLIPEA
ncbi:MAG: putative oxidoreductase, partial [Myxococcota bacterium]